MDDYRRFIAISRYARWLPELNRRETWPETVDRYMVNIVGDKVDTTTYYQLRQAILEHQVMPSMRAMMTAGEAALRDNTCIYNCSFLPTDHPFAFDEAMFILLCGTGVGFSVEEQVKALTKDGEAFTEQYVSQLPSVAEKFYDSSITITVEDSKEGWALSLRQLLALLWAGMVPQIDPSKVRPAGAKLKTFGGRASGPEPLLELFRFAIKMFKIAAGRKLTSAECHDLMCKIAEIVVVGGVRRSAMISLSDLDDQIMRVAKSGDWWVDAPQRALANNSVAYNFKPDAETFLQEWHALVRSKSGERGIFNREAAFKQAAKNGRRSLYNSTGIAWCFGTNPCSEIILRPYQFCNLSEVIVRADDTIETLREKVRLATILGTIQSTFTHFPYLRKIWQTNTEEERLLGVSMTGIMDNAILNGSANCELETGKQLWAVLNGLRAVAVETNKLWAEHLGIPVSVAITCVKPSGTVSQLTDSASGIHARHNPFYIRTVRGDVKDPLTQLMIAEGVPYEPCVMKPDTTVVFSFPQRAPDDAVTRNDRSAIEQLDLWLIYQRHWCEHKPSVTINIRDDEWMDAGAWVYRHFDEVSGISFLPHSDHSYQQAPYQDCTEEEYEAMKAKMPSAINWDRLSEFEKDDETIGSQTLACASGACELVDLK